MLVKQKTFGGVRLQDKILKILEKKDEKFKIVFQVVLTIGVLLSQNSMIGFIASPGILAIVLIYLTLNKYYSKLAAFSLAVLIPLLMTPLVFILLINSPWERFTNLSDWRLYLFIWLASLPFEIIIIIKSFEPKAYIFILPFLAFLYNLVLFYAMSYYCIIVFFFKVPPN